MGVITQLQPGEISAIATDIDSALFGQIAEGAKTQTYDFLIQRIEFAQGRHLDVQPRPDTHFTLKRTLGWDELANQMGLGGMTQLNMVKPLTPRAEHISGIAQLALPGLSKDEFTDG